MSSLFGLPSLTELDRSSPTRIWLGAVAPSTYEQAAQIANPSFTKALHLALREAGVLIMPSPYGRLYISFDHTDHVIEEIKTAFEHAAVELSAAYSG